MTNEETRTVLTILKTTYHNFYKDLSVTDMKGMLEIWQELFQDDDVNAVKTALKQLIMTSKFPPSIAEIKETVFNLCNENKMNVLEAWNIVKRNCVRNSEDARRRFDQLPIEIKNAIRNYQTLQEWADVNCNDIETHIYPRFRDMYNQAVNEIKINMISPNSQIEMKNNLLISQEFKSNEREISEEEKQAMINRIKGRGE